MIRVHRLENGQVTTVEGVDAVVAPQGEARTWFQVSAPSVEERHALVEAMPLHPLAFDDAVHERHPPKLEDFGGHLFIIARTPVDEGRLVTRKVAIFLAESWIVSVSSVPLETVKKVEEWVLSEPERFLSAPERIAHALLDHQVDGFEHMVEKLVDRVEALECSVGDEVTKDCLHSIQALRRASSRLMRVVRAQRDVFQSLSRTNHPVLSQRITPYLRDLYDHCLRIYDHLEGVRESLAAARDGYLSAVNNRLSETMRVLTVIATIMMPLSLIAGIFGMNFVQMPLLKDAVGFWVAMGGMLAIAGGMLFWFRRRGWI